MKNSRILQIRKQLDNTSLSFENYYKNTIKNLNDNKHLNACLEIVEDYKYASNNDKSKLNNILYAVKDNINVLDTTTTGGSLFFKNYKSPYSASVIKLLDQIKKDINENQLFKIYI